MSLSGGVVTRWIVVLAPNGKFRAQCCGPFQSAEKAQQIAYTMRQQLKGSDVYISPLLPVTRWDDLGEV